MYWKISLAAIILLLVTFVALPRLLDGQYQEYEILGQKYCVPNTYLVDPSPYWWILQTIGLDKERTSILYEFKGAELAKNIKGYIAWNGEVSQDVSGIITYLTPFEVERAKQSNYFSDLWYGTEGYQDRTFKLDKKSGLYIVYEFKNKRTWYLFKMQPNPNLEPPKSSLDLVVAGCQNMGRPVTRNGVPIHDRDQTLCTGSLQDGQLKISYSFSMENLYLLPKIKEYIYEKLKTWKSCSHNS